MARETKKLNARTVATVSEPGRYGDGAGLDLLVDKGGSKRWIFLFRWQGKLKEMGLGGLNSVSLALAREHAASAREQVAQKINPIASRRLAGAGTPNFGEFTDELLTSLSPQWRNEKHRAQWKMTLTRYAADLRPKQLDQITTDDVIAILRPLWSTKAETASRLRARVERVLDAAKAKGFRAGENPARWRGHLDQLLPKRQKLARGHHAALPYPDLPAFLVALRSRRALAALALEFTVLTAARSGETLGAQWDEVDLERKIWTIPPERMKAGREHRVPLSSGAIRILEMVAGAKVGRYVFPGNVRDRPLSVMAMEMVLRRMQVPVTVHGFRSTFRDWAGEETHFAREIAEAALAHAVGDQTERAYRRGDALEKGES